MFNVSKQRQGEQEEEVKRKSVHLLSKKASNTILVVLVAVIVVTAVGGLLYWRWKVHQIDQLVPNAWDRGYELGQDRGYDLGQDEGYNDGWFGSLRHHQPEHPAVREVRDAWANPQEAFPYPEL